MVGLSPGLEGSCLGQVLCPGGGWCGTGGDLEHNGAGTLQRGAWQRLVLGRRLNTLL